jgi:hypothetical protein
MKKYLWCLAFMVMISGCRAGDSPVFGMWEQLVVAETNVQKIPTRHDFIFSDKKLTKDTVFSALSDSFDGAICCVEVENLTPMDLEGLLAKYKWDSDDIDHLKSISGWKYIYQAKVVEPGRQNKNMRELVKNLSNTGDTSPFSSAVVSGDSVLTGASDGEYRFNGTVVRFSSSYSDAKDVMSYLFDFSGTRVKFTEMPFPSE